MDNPFRSRDGQENISVANAKKVAVNVRKFEIYEDRNKKTKEFIKEAGLCEEPLVWALEEKKTDRVIGQIIFHKYDDKRYEIGWIINKAYWHLGIADEVTKALIDFANENDINGLIIECAGAQEITKHIAKKNGFNMISEGEILVFERLCN